MRTWIAVGTLGLAVAATFVGARASSSMGGMVAVSDVEAAKLYGGGFTALLDGNKCEGTGAGCKLTTCYYGTEAGTRDSINKNCGSSACDNVTDDNGPCTGA